MVLPLNLLDIKVVGTTPRVDDLHLHAELARQRRAQHLNVVVVLGGPVECLLGQLEALTDTLDATRHHEARGSRLPMKVKITAQRILQEPRRLDLGLVESNDATRNGRRLKVHAVNAEDGLVIRLRDARLDINGHQARHRTEGCIRIKHDVQVAVVGVRRLIIFVGDNKVERGTVANVLGRRSARSVGLA